MNQQTNPQPISHLKTQINNNFTTNLDIRLTLGDDGGQQLMSSLNISVFSHISTNIKQMQTKLLQQIQSKQSINQDVLLVFRFSVQKGRQKDAMQFFQKGLDQQQNDMNISALQTLFHRPKSAGQIQLKQSQGSILVIYRLYKQYLGQTQLFFEQQKPGSILNIDFNVNLILKGSIVPCKKSYSALKPDYINMNITSNKIRAFDLVKSYMKQQGIDQDTQNNDFINLCKNLQFVKMSLKFNSLRRFIDYYDQILQYYVPVDQNGNKIYDDSTNIYRNDQQTKFPLLNKGIFKEKVQCKMIYSDKVAVNAVLTYKKEEVFFKIVAVLKEAFLKQTK